MNNVYIFKAVSIQFNSIQMLRFKGIKMMSCILTCSGEPGPQGFRGEAGPAGPKGKLHGCDLVLI